MLQARNKDFPVNAICFAALSPFRCMTDLHVVFSGRQRDKLVFIVHKTALGNNLLHERNALFVFRMHLIRIQSSLVRKL